MVTMMVFHSCLLLLLGPNCNFMLATLAFKKRENHNFRASDFFQNWWAEVTHGAQNGGSFSVMMSPNMSNEPQLTLG